MNSSELVSLIAQYASNPDSQAIADLLNAETVEVTHPGRKTMGELKDILGAADTAALLGVMDAVGAVNPLVKAAYFQLNSQGLDISDPDVQAAVDGLVSAGLDPAIGAAVKAIGIEYTSIYKQWLGPRPYDGPITAADVTAAKAIYTLREQWTGKMQDVEAGINAGTITTWAELVAEVQA